MIGKLRAWYRIIAVLLMTAWSISGLILRQLFKPAMKKELATRYRALWARRAVKLLGLRINLEGSLPPEGVVIISNHRSYIDPPPILAAIPCTMLSKAEVAKMPVIGYGAVAVDIVFVERGSMKSRMESLDKIADVLKRGVSVVVFPEGTTNPESELLPFKPGVFNMAAKNNCPIVPLALTYTNPDDVWKNHEKMYHHFMRVFSRKSIEINFKLGPVIRTDDPKEAIALSEKWIKETVDKMENLKTEKV